jgi:putative chitinase
VAEAFPDTRKSAAYERNPEKLANFVYANRMGNGTPESRDGFRYRGRGLIPDDRRGNYAAVSDALKIDFVGGPDLMLEPRHAAMCAAWFWRTRGSTNWLTTKPTTWTAKTFGRSRASSMAG